MNYRYSNGRIFFLTYKYHSPFSEAMASFKWVSILWKLYRNMVFRQPWPCVFPLLGYHGLFNLICHLLSTVLSYMLSPCMNVKASGLQEFCLVDFCFHHKKRYYLTLKSTMQHLKLLAYLNDTHVTGMILR